MELQVVYHLQKDERKHQFKPSQNYIYIKQHHKTDFTFCFKKADKIPCILDVFQSGSTLVLMVCFKVAAI